MQEDTNRTLYKPQVYFYNVNWYSLHTWPWICNDMYLTCDLWLFVIFLSSAITNYGKHMTIDGVHVLYRRIIFLPFSGLIFSRLTTCTCAGPCTCVWFPERWLVHVQALVVCRCTWAWCIFFYNCVTIRLWARGFYGPIVNEA